MWHGPAIWAGSEDLTRQDSPVYAGYLADAAYIPVELATQGKLVPLLDEDHEVDRAGDQHVRRLDRQSLRRLDRIGGNPVEHLDRGVGVNGGQRAVVTLGHRVQHRDDLVAEHLADDDPAGVH